MWLGELHACNLSMIILNSEQSLVVWGKAWATCILRSYSWRMHLVMKSVLEAT